MSTAAEAIFSLSLLKKEHFCGLQQFFYELSSEVKSFRFQAAASGWLLEFSENCFFGSLAVALEAAIWWLKLWKVHFAIKSKLLVKDAFILH